MARRYYDLPSLTALAVFEASARHLSFKSAAVELNVTPGAVSRQIKTLEREAGTALFERIHRGVELTAAGEELYEVLSRSFSQSAEVFQRIRSQTRRASVTVGATTAFASMWLMSRLGSFWRSHQDITINHQISDNPQDLSHPSIDLRIRYGTGQWPGEAVRLLFGDCMYPVCGPQFAEHHAGATVDDLLHLPLLQLQSLDPFWTDWEEWLRRAGKAPASLNVRKFNNYVIALQAARDNQGVALGWHSLVEPMLDAGKLVRLTDVDIEAPGSFYVTWHAERSLSAPAQTLRDWLIEEAETPRRVS